MDFGLTPEALRSGLIFFLLLFAVLVLRAYAQAWLADKLGDPTPRNDGRVTLYPPPHVDLLGTVVIPLICIFMVQPHLGELVFFLAWAKPVPTNPSYFKHPRRGELFTQFAGFMMCVLIGIGAAVVGGVLYKSAPLSLQISVSLIGICAMLMVLDLLPIPPLPGGALLRYWGVISEETYWSVSRWSGLAFILLIQLPPVRKLLGILIQIAASPFEILLNIIAR